MYLPTFKTNQTPLMPRIASSSLHANLATIGTVCCVAVLHVFGFWFLWRAPHSPSHLAFPQAPAAYGTYRSASDRAFFQVTLQTSAPKASARALLQTKQLNPPSPASASIAKRTTSHHPQKKDNPPPASKPFSSLPLASLAKSASITHTPATPPICHAPTLHYPAQARRLGQYGTVLIQLTLGTTGQVEKVAVQRSSGFTRLDDAACRAALHASCLASTKALPRYTYLQFQFDLLD